MVDRPEKDTDASIKHGGYSQVWRKAIRGDLDGRSLVSRAVKDLRAALVRDLGGPETISTQKSLILDRAICKVFKCQGIETALYEGEDISPNTIGLYLALSNSLRKDLTALGLNRVARKIGEEKGAFDLDKLSLDDLDRLSAMKKKMEAEKEKK